MLAVQSIFHVAFLRGLFPDNYFMGTSMDNLEGEHTEFRKADLLSSESTSQLNCTCKPWDSKFSCSPKQQAFELL